MKHSVLHQLLNGEDEIEIRQTGSNFTYKINKNDGNLFMKVVDNEDGSYKCFDITELSKPKIYSYKDGEHIKDKNYLALNMLYLLMFERNKETLYEVYRIYKCECE